MNFYVVCMVRVESEICGAFAIGRLITEPVYCGLYSLSVEVFT